jgi:hypothetical protein
MTPSLTRPHSLGQARGNSHTYMQMRERPDPGPRPRPPSYLNATNPDLHLRSTARRRDGTRHRAHTHMQMQNHITSDTQSKREREGMAPLTCAPAIGARSPHPLAPDGRRQFPESCFKHHPPLRSRQSYSPTRHEPTEAKHAPVRQNRQRSPHETFKQHGHFRNWDTRRRNDAAPSLHQFTPAAPHPANANPNLLPNPESYLPSARHKPETRTATTTSLRQSNARADTSNRNTELAPKARRGDDGKIPAARNPCSGPRGDDEET